MTERQQKRRHSDNNHAWQNTQKPPVILQLRCFEMVTSQDMTFTLSSYLDLYSKVSNLSKHWQIVSRAASRVWQNESKEVFIHVCVWCVCFLPNSVRWAKEKVAALLLGRKPQNLRGHLYLSGKGNLCSWALLLHASSLPAPARVAKVPTNTPTYCLLIHHLSIFFRYSCYWLDKYIYNNIICGTKKLNKIS